MSCQLCRLQAIYSNKSLHMELKKKDSLRRKLKAKEQKLRRKYVKFSEEKSSKMGKSSSQVTPQNSKLIVSKAIWNHMSPKSKYKVVRSLKV